MAGAGDLVLKTRALTKRFGKLVAVDRIDLDVRRGDLYGFLGPNGAGKTTTIRMLLRLIRPSSGEIEVLGKPLDRHYLTVLRDVGAMVEEPAFYPYLSGRRNLQVFASLVGGVSSRRIDEVLELVGLSRRGKDKVRVYSQGMRQRLGIAQAMLARPKLLFLDEPTTGLDPPGIEEMRRLFKRLSHAVGVTVFLSSHLHHEVELLCNHVAILNLGRLVVEGEVRSLLETVVVKVEIRVDRRDVALELLRRLDWVETPGGGGGLPGDGGSLFVRAPRERTAELNGLLVERGIRVHEITPRRPSLEEFFREKHGLAPPLGASAGTHGRAEPLALTPVGSGAEPLTLTLSRGERGPEGGGATGA